MNHEEDVTFDPLPLPGCGHPGQYAYTEDGGKHIVCLVCEFKQKGALPNTVEVLDRADRLLTQCLTVLMDKRIADYIPWGMKDAVHDFVVGNFGGDAVTREKAYQSKGTDVYVRTHGNVEKVLADLLDARREQQLTEEEWDAATDALEAATGEHVEWRTRDELEERGAS